jgi:hypothetical protein
MDFTGKPLTGFVYVAPDGFETDEALADWIAFGEAFLSALPPKSSDRGKVGGKRKRRRSTA